MSLHLIELTIQEEELLYQNNECPKRMHITYARIWWVPKEQYDIHTNMYSYSICPKCYREKKDIMNKLINEIGQFIPILTNNILAFNCDASNLNETYNILLDDNWKIGIYQKNDNNIVLLDGIRDNNNINIYVDNYPINIMIGLGMDNHPISYGKMENINDEGEAYTFYISNAYGLFNIYHLYSMNNEYVFTLSNINMMNENIHETEFKDIMITEYYNTFDIRFHLKTYKNHNYKLNFIKKNHNINDIDEINDVDEINDKQEENYQNYIIEL